MLAVLPSYDPVFVGRLRLFRLLGFLSLCYLTYVLLRRHGMLELLKHGKEPKEDVREEAQTEKLDEYLETKAAYKHRAIAWKNPMSKTTG